MIKTSLDWSAPRPNQSPPRKPNNLPRTDDFHAENSPSNNSRPNDQSSAMLSPLSESDSRPKPFWDVDRRELRLGKIVIKRFRWPAENQERILIAFQEENWPTHIDDPIVPHDSICPKRRLHDTLKCLNRKQENPLIKFRGDGTGTGVRLEFVNHLD